MAKKILIVDDEPNIRGFVSAGLSLEGYKVLEAEDGQGAVKKAAAEQPDLIIMDVNMPVMNGWDALAELKKNPKTQPIPVLMLTAESVVRDVDKAMDIGAAAYQTKPFDIDRLLKKVSLILNRGAA